MTDHEVGSGNVFVDIGFSQEEAEQLAVKSGLADQIGRIIEARGLRQVEAAALLGTDQPTLSKVLRGRLAGVSVERLTQWLTALGYDVQVRVSAKTGDAVRGRFSISVAAE